MLVRIVIGLAYVAIAAGHGAVVIPPPRQAIDRSLAPWNGTVPLHHPNVESKTGWCPVPASGSNHCDVMHVAVFDTQFFYTMHLKAPVCPIYNLMCLFFNMFIKSHVHDAYVCQMAMYLDRMVKHASGSATDARWAARRQVLFLLLLFVFVVVVVVILLLFFFFFFP